MSKRSTFFSAFMLRFFLYKFSLFTYGKFHSHSMIFFLNKSLKYSSNILTRKKCADSKWVNMRVFWSENNSNIVWQIFMPLKVQFWDKIQSEIVFQTIDISRLFYVKIENQTHLLLSKIGGIFKKIWGNHWKVKGVKSGAS